MERQQQIFGMGMKELKDFDAEDAASNQDAQVAQTKEGEGQEVKVTRNHKQRYRDSRKGVRKQHGSARWLLE